MESGHLRKLEQFGEAVPVLEMFTNIWGVGAKTAQLWYQQVRNMREYKSAVSRCAYDKKKLSSIILYLYVYSHMYIYERLESVMNTAARRNIL